MTNTSKVRADFAKKVNYKMIIINWAAVIIKMLMELDATNALERVFQFVKTNKFSISETSQFEPDNEQTFYVILQEVCHARREKGDGFDCPTAIQKYFKIPEAKELYHILNGNDYLTYFIIKGIQRYKKEGANQERTLHVMQRFHEESYSWEKDDSNTFSYGERNQNGVLKEIFLQDPFFAEYANMEQQIKGTHTFIKSVADLFIVLQSSEIEEEKVVDMNKTDEGDNPMMERKVVDDKPIAEESQKSMETKITPSQLISNQEKIKAYFSAYDSYISVKQELQKAGIDPTQINEKRDQILALFASCEALKL